MPNFIQGILTAGGRTYATWSTVNKSSDIVLPAGYGNLKFQSRNGGTGTGISTIGITDTAYWEIRVDKTLTPTGAAPLTFAGVGTAFNNSARVGAYSNSISYRANAGVGTTFLPYGFLRNALASGPASPTKFIAGDILGFAIDVPNLTFKFFINNVQQSTTQTLPVGGTWYAVCSADGTLNDGGTANFGASPFIYAVPAGYTAGIYN
jgi:hypothetical protein